jgi:hypothetical protein
MLVPYSVYAQSVTTVYTFPSNLTSVSSLIQAADGDLYGIASGYETAPVIFKVLPTGAYSVVYTYPYSSQLGA